VTQIHTYTTAHNKLLLLQPAAAHFCWNRTGNSTTIYLLQLANETRLRNSLYVRK